MSEALMIGGLVAFTGGGLLIHRAGLAYSFRVMGNWCYSLAFAVDHFRAEFSRMNAEAKRMA
tara:strand:+ start:3533 stop:3718 length:186 start_codon:yes stop_codon:yes gene_type:complete